MVTTSEYTKDVSGLSTLFFIAVTGELLTYSLLSDGKIRSLFSCRFQQFLYSDSLVAVFTGVNSLFAT